MKYLSVCSGIEAATVAWHELGWTPVGFAEIDKFASAVLAARFGSNLPGEPLASNGVPNFGDFTSINLDNLGAVDLLVGGTPCQAFSFAGKRLSLADARGNLTLAYAVLAHELVRSHGLRNALWENVPGVLSTEDNAFGCFLGALVGADDALPLPPGAKRWPDAGMVAGPRARAAWRVLDAQYFGLAQRRERVFVVVDFGNGADPAAVLFEPQGLQGNTPPRREKGEGFTPDVAGCLTSSGRGVERPGDSRWQDPIIAERIETYGGGNRSGSIDVAATLTAKGNKQDFEVETFVAETFSADADCGGQDTLVFAPERAATLTCGGESQGKGGYASRRQEDDVNLVAFAIQAGALRENPDSGPDGMGVQQDHAYTLEARAEVQAVVCPIDMRQASRGEKLTNNRKEGSSGGAPGTGIGSDGDPAHTIGTSHIPAVAYDMRGREGGAQFEGPHETANIRAANGGSSRSYVQQGWAVRRLTTVECARLQGFDDCHSRIAWRGKPAEECPDGPQYKTYGNSMAVNVMRWLGRRIELVDKLGSDK